MNTKLFFTLLLLVACGAGQSACAKIWRVNNNGFGAQYTTLAAANNDPNVLAGDTIHLEASNTEYNTTVLNKSLIIIGPGYFLPENPKTTLGGSAAKIYGIDFVSGSAGSALLGVTIGQGSCDINVGNITVQRCKLESGISIYNSGSPAIANVQIVQNFFPSTGSTGTTLYISGSGGAPTGLKLNNNIFQRPLDIDDYATGFTISECNNNVFDVPAFTSAPSVKLLAASFKNNILSTPTATVKINGITNFNTTSSPSVTHNVGSSAAVHFGTANNNIVVTNPTTSLFVPASTNSSDGKYQLLSGSPASGNGSDGSDRGAFGGAAIQNRYTLSGLAPIPVIYEVATTGVASPTTGLPVTVKSRTIQ